MSDNRGREGRLKVRVRTARGRKTSSTRWLQRQLNDPYVSKAKAEGYRSRAAYKLIEIDDQQHLLKPGQSALDLGSAPGGWSQVAAERVKSREGQGRVVGIDIQEVAEIPGVEFMQMDFLSPDAPARLEALLGGRVDHVLSDMAPHATGHKTTDHLKIMALCEAALDFARQVLKPGGSFLAKVLQGGTQNELLAQMKRDFAVVKHVKPKASRADSSELYVLATGFRGGGEDGGAEGPGAEA
ncbi:RlmE family RNA methyltransferase [Lutibaculum baratangense]|uniref:Ribosomal RNA large subunit methyltransferase E n=1 Tax=Lutibaculum baratangense AMV1 TaxID=631454 RepID=V4TAF4_9HYPH|nr:RlmE family RNA methyltransferase [Lutibaculum baratangense]ESR23413.1 Cell division protein FtsJ [Lutibaculum baratangense AMV1]